MVLYSESWWLPKPVSSFLESLKYRIPKESEGVLKDKEGGDAEGDISKI